VYYCLLRSGTTVFFYPKVSETSISQPVSVSRVTQKNKGSHWRQRQKALLPLAFACLTS